MPSFGVIVGLAKLTFTTAAKAMPPKKIWKPLKRRFGAGPFPKKERQKARTGELTAKTPSRIPIAFNRWDYA